MSAWNFRYLEVIFNYSRDYFLITDNYCGDCSLEKQLKMERSYPWKKFGCDKYFFINTHPACGGKNYPPDSNLSFRWGLLAADYRFRQIFYRASPVRDATIISQFMKLHIFIFPVLIFLTSANQKTWPNYVRRLVAHPFISLISYARALMRKNC